MPRDVRDFTKPGVRKHVTYVYPSEVPSFTQTYACVQSKTRSTRSDIVKTQPIGDSYFRTTAYHAFFSTVSCNAGECIFADKNTSVPNKYFIVWDGADVDDVWRYGCNASLNPNVPSWLVAQVRSRILSRIRNTDLDIGVSAGEMKQTVRSITAILGRILNIVRGFRRRYGSGSYSNWSTRKVLKSSASAWLGYQYGVKPLMSDIFALSEELSKQARGPELFKVFEKSIDPTYGPSTWPSANFANWLTGSFERGFKAGYSFSISNPQVFDAWRYGLTSPLSLAWELTPYSFVIDWFTNLGAFLNGLSAPLGVVFSSSYETSYVDATFTRHRDVYWHYVGQNVTRDIVFNATKMEAYVRLKAMKRTSPLYPPAPPPYLTVDLNVTQAINSIALILARL